MQSEPAFMRLGDCHRNGFGTEQDAREAVRCYEQAARTNKEALISLG
jgi:TPR repeat protein